MYCISTTKGVYSSSRGRERAVKPPWVQKTKGRNTSNTHSHEHTRSSTHPPTMCCSNTAEYSSRCVDDTNRVAMTQGFPCFYDYPPPIGSKQTLRREALARRVVHRRPFFHRQVIGLLCGKGVEPPRGRGKPSGAREWQLFCGYIITKTNSKIHFDITTTTTEEHYIIRTR